MSPAAAKVVDAMQGNPALLAVIVLQLATLAVVYFVASANAEKTHLREIALIDACGLREGNE